MPLRLTLSELRVAWILLGLVLALVFGAPPAARWMWVAGTALPWSVGAVFLMSRRYGSATSASWSGILSDPGPRLALLALGVLLALSAHVFSPSAAVFLFTWAASLGIVIAATSRATGTLRSVLLSGTAAVTALALSLTAVEVVLMLPPLAVRLGLPVERAAWTSRYDRLWERNVFGFRSQYEKVARDPGVRRVVVIGDSFTWGDKIASTESTWPARFEEALHRAYAGTRFQVVNMAQRGYTTANEAELLRRLGWQFDPDLVVVQFVVNDALPSGPNFDSEGEAWLLPQRRLLPVRFRSGLVRWSGVLALLEIEYNAIRNGRRAHLEFRKLYEEEFVGWRQTQAALHEIADSARARRIPIVLMLFPGLLPGSWSGETYPLTAIHQRVKSVAGSVGFHVLDLTPVFAERGGDWRRWWATPYDAHPGAEAHALAAEALLHEVGAEAWFSDSASLR